MNLFPKPRSPWKSALGFTLAELLISLAILGVIATFTIPKVLVAQQNNANNANAKQMVAALSNAYQAYLRDGGSKTTMRTSDLTPYLNYLSIDNTVTLDALQTQGNLGCPYQCLKFHNGGVLFYWLDGLCPGSNAAGPFFFDPDGKITDGTTNGPGKTLALYLYSDGRVKTSATMDTGTNWSAGGGGTCNLSRNPDASLDPPWLNWN